MNGWIETFKATGLEELVAHYRRLMKPKAGRRCNKALAEIRRQRDEKLAYVERLRLEAAALFVVERELLAEAENNRAQPKELCVIQ